MSERVRVAAPSLQSSFALGSVGGAVSTSLGYLAYSSSKSLLAASGINTNHPRIFLRIYSQFQSISNSMIQLFAKVSFLFYLVVFIPIVEEWLFRDVIYSKQVDGGGGRVFRVLTNAVLFGALHFSLFLGWSNVPAIAFVTIAGVVFAALRELTGDHRASIIAHSINNCVVVFIGLLTM